MPHNIVAFPRLSMLTREQCEVIHLASLEILRRTGVRVYHDGVLALLHETELPEQPRRQLYQVAR